MRIKKVSQTTPTQAQIVDGYSTSTTDGYSCNYINQKTNIITAYLNQNYVITTSNTYEKIPLDGSESVGSKLTLNSSGEIVIGAGVTKVKVSAKICMVGSTIVTGTKNFVIMKNNNIAERIWNKIDTFNSTLIIPTSMFSVAEGDKITMAYYGVQNETANYGAQFTTLTVEVVE